LFSSRLVYLAFCVQFSNYFAAEKLWTISLLCKPIAIFSKSLLMTITNTIYELLSARRVVYLFLARSVLLTRFKISVSHMTNYKIRQRGVLGKRRQVENRLLPTTTVCCHHLCLLAIISYMYIWRLFWLLPLTAANKLQMYFCG